MSRLSAALSSATQHAMPPEFNRKLGTESLNTRFPLPTPLCAGYIVKLIKKKDKKFAQQHSVYIAQYNINESNPINR